MSSKQNLPPTRTRVLALFVLMAFVSIAVSASASSAALFGRLLPGAQSGPAVQPAAMTAAAAPAPLAAAPDEQAGQPSARVTVDRTDYQPGATVIITGTGFMPGETVSLVLRENPPNHPDTHLTAVADDQGNFTNTEFSPTEEHLGVTFTLTATGLGSGRTDDTTFTDGTPYSYSPSEPLLTIQTGPSVASGSYSQTVVAPRVSQGTINASLQVIAPGANSAAGWIQLTPTTSQPFNTQSASEGPRTNTWTVTVNVPANTTPGDYTAILKATTPITEIEQGAGATLTVRVTAPTVTDTAPPVSSASATAGGNPYNGVNFTNQNVTVTLSAIDSPNPGASGVANTFYSLSTDALGYRTSPNPFTISSEGVTVVTFYSVDNAGNSEAVAPSEAKTFTVKIDKTKPVITLLGDNPMTVAYGDTFTDPGAEATEGLTSSIVVSGTVDTNVVGDYTLSYDVSDAAGNAAETATRTVHVVKADQTIAFGPLADKTYGDPDFEVSATAGSGEPVSFSASGNCTVAGSTVHLTGAGSCTITASQAGNANYDPAEPVSQSFNIAKAAATIDVQGYTGVYDGNAHGATGTATGVEGEDLSSLLDLGASFTDAPGGAANWTFAGNDNYNSESGSVAVTISKADATVVVNGATVTYDGQPHGASGTATGVNGESLSGLDLGDSFTDVPGGTANWTFTGGVNYNDQSGTASIVINKADATVSVTGGTFTYNGTARGATGTATGAGGEDLSSLLDLGASFTNVPGGTANWTFPGDNNHNTANGSVEIVIEKANATVDVNGYTGTYDGQPHGATGTATGAGGEDLSSLLDLGASFTNAPGGAADWTFPGDNNHHPAQGTASIVINQKGLTITASSPADITYGDAAPAVTPIYAGFIAGEGASNLTTAPTCGTAYAAGSNAGSYATTCSGAAAVNYSISYVAGSLQVNPAPLTVKADDKSKIFDGTPFTAFTVTYTGFVLGQNESVLGGALTFNTTPSGATAVGTYQINPSGLSSNNYAISFSPGTLTIASWTLRGFYQPVEMSNGTIVWNTIKGGSTVPLKFNIFAGTAEKTSTADVKSFTAGPVPCTIGIEDAVDLNQITTTGGTTLRYDLTGRQFIQNWQTPKQSGLCLKVTMTAQDGSTLSAFFKTK